MKTASECSLWDLAGVEARAFGRGGRSAAPARMARRAQMLLAVAAFDRRVHSSGQALCLLAPRWSRLLVSFGALAVIAGLLGALAPALGWALLALLAASVLPSSVRATWALPATRRLHRLNPPGRHVYVHSVASVRPGAGAEVLRSLVREADQRGWSLVLDAANDRLANYYSAFGFVRRSQGITMPDGTCRVRMWREANPTGRRLS